MVVAVVGFAVVVVVVGVRLPSQLSQNIVSLSLERPEGCAVVLSVLRTVHRHHHEVC